MTHNPTEETREEESTPAGEEGEESGGTRGAASIPRIPVTQATEIDLIREQLENFGRVVILRSASVHVAERSVNLLSRALRVPRVPRSAGPTHFSIPRHVDRAGALMESTEQWDAVNWRTRAAKPKGSHALLLAKPALRVLPERGQMTYDQIEESLRAQGANGVYEPLAVAILPLGEARASRADLFPGMPESPSSGRIRSRLVDMAASVFRGSREASKEPLTVSDEAKARWAEKIAPLNLTQPYILVAPFGTPSEGIHDWAVERCAEVLRHANEWRKVQSIIVATGDDKGKAERLRIISGANVAHIVADLTDEEVAAAVAGARAVLASPGHLATLAGQLGVSTVCIAGPAAIPVSATPPHIIVRPEGNEMKQVSTALGVEEHGCLEGLEAGPVARALSKVLVAAEKVH